MQVVSRSLRQSQELIVGVPNNPVDLIQTGADSAERMEVEMTNHYCDNHNDSSSSAATDLLAWCQVRREVHQQELAMLNNHILQLNRTNSNLNALLEKQSNFIAKHLALNEQRDLEISTLQQRYEDAAKRAEERASDLENETATLRQEGMILADANETMRLEILRLQKTIEELNCNKRDLEDKNKELIAELKKSKDEGKSLQKNIQHLNQQLESALSKNSKLEDDIKLKENELDQLHNTLKQRQVQIDAIQSILGPQFAGKFDLS
jgi:chromosome segregation ATPase